jgi:hypothetical protein
MQLLNSTPRCLTRSCSSTRMSALRFECLPPLSLPLAPFSSPLPLLFPSLANLISHHSRWLMWDRRCHFAMPYSLSQSPRRGHGMCHVLGSSHMPRVAVICACVGHVCARWSCVRATVLCACKGHVCAAVPLSLCGSDCRTHTTFARTHDQRTHT